MSGELKIGEVVYNNDIPMVVIDCVNYEDYGSMSYDRKYKLCLLSEIKGRMYLVDDVGMWVTIKGTKFPEIERVENVAPFEIEKITAYKVRQKKAKTITVYE